MKKFETSLGFSERPWARSAIRVASLVCDPVVLRRELKAQREQGVAVLRDTVEA